MEKLLYVKTILENNLKNNIIPFWDKMLDPVNGAFYGEWNDQPIPKSDKGTVYLSRLLWSNAILYKTYRDKKFLNYANKIFSFMEKHLYDYNYKGFYWSCSANGKIKNDHKHLYAQSFCLYGLSEYISICENLGLKNKVIRIIFDLVSIIKLNFVDFPHNYSEESTKDFKRCDNILLEGYKMIPEITTNTLLHLVESLGTCYKILKIDFVKVLTLKIIDIIFKYGYDYKRNSLIQFLDYNLLPTVDVISYGHDIEVSWLLNDVLDNLDLKEEEIKNYRNILEQLGYASLEGFNGKYLISEKINGEITNKEIIWWVQAEALITLKRFYEKTNDEEYLNKMVEIVNVLKTAIMTDNEWLWAANENYEPTTFHHQAEIWKANYHNIRCILKILEV